MRIYEFPFTCSVGVCSGEISIVGEIEFTHILQISSYWAGFFRNCDRIKFDPYSSVLFFWQDNTSNLEKGKGKYCSEFLSLFQVMRKLESSFRF